MRAILQRVSQASVTVQNEVVGSIDAGWLVLVGFAATDSDKDQQYILDKILNLRAFPDEEGKMNLSVTDIAGELLIVSQFTLYADCRQGRRPGFSDAAKPEHAQQLYHEFISNLKRKTSLKVATGIFQADMAVNLCNDGPVTLMLDSEKGF